MIVGIIGIAALILILVVVSVVSRKKNKAREMEYQAAAMLLKERQLRNAIDMNKKQNSNREQMVLVVTWKEEKERKFIFDPASGVRIGRGREENQICVPLDTVSHKHCIIFSSGDSIYVQDLNSANGTFIKRGFKKFRVTDTALCQENDTIIVGGVGFKIRSFYVDSAYLS